MPELQFAATITGAFARARRASSWTRRASTFPVGWDEPPPVLFNLYRVAFCSTAFVERGGKLHQFEANSPLDEEELRVGAEELLAP